MENFEFNTEKIEKAAELLRAVAHHLRLKIIKLIHEKKRSECKCDLQHA